MELLPMNGCVLVEIGASPYKHAAVVEGKFDSRTNGVVVAVPEADSTLGHLIGKRVYWNDYQEGTLIRDDDKTYSFIKYEDIRGCQK